VIQAPRAEMGERGAFVIHPQQGRARSPGGPRLTGCMDGDAQTLLGVQEGVQAGGDGALIAARVWSGLSGATRSPSGSGASSA
jgi:hypothetical protein